MIVLLVVPTATTTAAAAVVVVVRCCDSVVWVWQWPRHANGHLGCLQERHRTRRGPRQLHAMLSRHRHRLVQARSRAAHALCSPTMAWFASAVCLCLSVPLSVWLFRPLSTSLACSVCARIQTHTPFVFRFFFLLLAPPRCRCASTTRRAHRAGRVLSDAGIIPGADMTPECALTKLSYILSMVCASHTQTDTQTHRHAHRHTQTHTDTHTHRHRHRHRHTHTDTHTPRLLCYWMRQKDKSYREKCALMRRNLRGELTASTEELEEPKCVLPQPKLVCTRFSRLCLLTWSTLPHSCLLLCAGTTMAGLTSRSLSFRGRFGRRCCAVQQQRATRTCSNRCW